MQLPVTLKLVPSRSLAAALVFAHGLAALGLGLSGLPPSLALPGMCLLAASLGVALWQHLVHPGVESLTLGADGTLVLRRRAGDPSGIAAQIHSQTTVFPWLVVLLLRTEAGRKLAVVLPPDALGRDNHRQLRLWLRWKASAAGA